MIAGIFGVIGWIVLFLIGIGVLFAIAARIAWSRLTKR